MDAVSACIRRGVALARSAPRLVAVLLLVDFNIYAAAPLLTRAPLLNEGLVPLRHAPRPQGRRWQAIFLDFSEIDTELPAHYN
eukprot:2931348-Pyramimonas_sp.AAC.1